MMSGEDGQWHVNGYGRRYATGKSLSVELREQIVAMAVKGVKASKISKAVGVSHSTVRKVINAYKETGSVAMRTDRRSRKRVLKPRLVRLIRLYRQEDPGISVKAIRKRLLEDNICCSQTLPSPASVTRCLKKPADESEKPSSPSLSSTTEIHGVQRFTTPSSEECDIQNCVETPTSVGIQRFTTPSSEECYIQNCVETPTSIGTQGITTPRSEECDTEICVETPEGQWTFDGLSASFHPASTTYQDTCLWYPYQGYSSPCPSSYQPESYFGTLTPPWDWNTHPRRRLFSEQHPTWSNSPYTPMFTPETMTVPRFSPAFDHCHWSADIVMTRSPDSSETLEPTVIEVSPESALTSLWSTIYDNQMTYQTNNQTGQQLQ